MRYDRSSVNGDCHQWSHAHLLSQVRRGFKILCRSNHSFNHNLDNNLSFSLHDGYISRYDPCDLHHHRIMYRGYPHLDSRPKLPSSRLHNNRSRLPPVCRNSSNLHGHSTLRLRGYSCRWLTTTCKCHSYRLLGRQRRQRRQWRQWQFIQPRRQWRKRR